jgi:NCAIR mutase (PurE)-related protein
MSRDVQSLLAEVAAGVLSPAEAAVLLRAESEADVGFAHVDLARRDRCGLSEVIYCPGKTPAQVASISKALARAGQDVLATRATREQYEAVRVELPSALYHETARAVTVDVRPMPPRVGLVCVVCAGTTDITVAEECALTAERMGANVEKLFDVGVAGLHRLTARLDLLRRARVLVVVAGMEGALPSVVGGLVNAPVIAVPTSVGYGASLHGIAALLAMLNSCVAGITVVNIDNGFGAGVAAAMINRTRECAAEKA